MSSEFYISSVPGACGGGEQRCANTLPGLMDPRTSGVLCRYHKTREASEVGDGIFFINLGHGITLRHASHKQNVNEAKVSRCSPFNKY